MWVGYFITFFEVRLGIRRTLQLLKIDYLLIFVLFPYRGNFKIFSQTKSQGARYFLHFVDLCYFEYAICCCIILYCLAKGAIWSAVPYQSIETISVSNRQKIKNKKWIEWANKNIGIAIFRNQCHCLRIRRRYWQINGFYLFIFLFYLFT